MLAVDRREADLAILARYHEKVKDEPRYPKRKRGNPQTLIEAAARLRGGKQCMICGTLNEPELHHEDFDWRNNRLDNLNFYCHQHHRAIHNGLISTGAIIMNITKTKTDTQIQELRTEVLNIMQQKGCGKEKAYGYLSAQKGKWWSGLSSRTIQNYNIPGARERARQHQAAAYRRKAEASGKPVRSRGGYTLSTTMSAAEAVEFYQFLKKSGITIS